MKRRDCGVLWLADRAPLSVVFSMPVIMATSWAPGLLGRAIAVQLGISPHWDMVACFAWGALAALAGEKLAARWLRRRGFKKCQECFRLGRWALRLTVDAPDYVTIPAPIAVNTGCWCDRHYAAHLARCLGHEVFTTVAVVPYDPHWR